MTLEQVSALSQTVAATAVVVSLVYLALQTRQTAINQQLMNTIELGNAQRDVLNQTRNWWMLYAQDEETFNLISACLQNYKGASRYHQARFNAWSMNLLHIVEQVFFQQRSGLMFSTSHDGYMAAMLAIIKMPGGREWWAEASNVVNADLSAYLSRRLKGDSEGVPLFTDLLPHLLLPGGRPATATKA